MMLLASLHICHGKISVTYSFPTDSCVSAPYLVDEDTIVIMTFEGDFGSPDCRQLSFTTSKSAFYSYTMCMKELYFSSPQCQSKVYYRWYWSYYDYDYDSSYDYNSEKVKAAQTTQFMKEGIAQGFSAELAGAGILLCSCVICRRQNCKQHEQDQCEKVTVETDCTSADSEKKWEPVTDLKDKDTAPLCDS
ncbi:hypothetical protein AM593_03648, partial [Mytilus galloprovincialis]